MTREGAEIIRGAMRAISEQCMKIQVHVETTLCATARICPVMICLSVFLTIDFGRWSNECCYGN